MNLSAKLIFCALISSLTVNAHSLKVQRDIYKADYQWAIVGGGPAGIIITLLLLDLGTDPKDIVWIDPEFNVGRLGKYYGNVPGNSTTDVWIEFLKSFKCFKDCMAQSLEKLYTLDQNKAYELNVIIEPLTEITAFLQKKLTTKKTFLRTLDFQDNNWHLTTDESSFSAGHVVLTIGSHPKRLDYDCKNEIPLDLALDKSTLATYVNNNDTVAVVGSAQSAILLLKYLSELPIGRYINFYRHQPNYENELFGMTAEWAKTVLAKNPPVNLLRVYNTPEALKAWLPICTKIIYAVGYDRNQMPTMPDSIPLNLDDKNGIIGSRLFGFGIAFPEKLETDSGHVQSKIGLISFLDYAQRIVPLWIGSKKVILSRYASYEDLFTIDLL